MAPHREAERQLLEEVQVAGKCKHGGDQLCAGERSVDCDSA